MLPLKSKNPPESRPIATISLIAVNVIVFFLTCGPDLRMRPEFAETLALSRAHLSIVTLTAHLFLHENLLHLLGNMWFLYLFGFAVEGRLRAVKFLTIYFYSGVLAALAYLAIFGSGGIVLVGASGAIMGVLGASLYIFPFGQVQFLSGFGPSSWQLSTWNMISVAIYYLGLDVLFMFIGSSGVAHLAHIAGALAGFGICALFRPRRDSKRASEAKAMLHEAGDRALLSSSELAAMAASNPNDTNLVLNWMQRGIKDGNVKPECMSAFLRLLPKIIQKEPAPGIGFVLVSLLAIDAPIPSVQLLKVARSLELSDEGALARRLYESVLRNPKSSSADIEAALFRSALVMESMSEHKDAASAYNDLIDRFPMSPMADQARVRRDQLPLYK